MFSSQIHISQLFNFLKQYYALKYPLISELEKYEFSIWLDAVDFSYKPESGTPIAVIPQSHELFYDLYKLYDQLRREPEAAELFIGDALLYHSNSKQVIHHPLVTQPISLEFDPTIPAFHLYLKFQPPYLSREILLSNPQFSNSMLLELFKKYDKSPISPINLKSHPKLLNTIGYLCASNAKILSSPSELSVHMTEPQFYLRTILFLKKRTKGYSTAIDTLLEDFNVDQQIPSFLQGIDQSVPFLNETHEVRATEFLFTKPINREQLLVSHYLQDHNTVLVQGPPGTGKTHTIANIIGNLLAEGKKILVTSSNEKGLSVLKDYIPKPLQSFCLSLFSDSENREKMGNTLDDLQNLRNQLETIDLPLSIHQLQTERESVIKQIECLKEEMLQLRMLQYQPIKIGHKLLEPAEVFLWLKEKQISGEHLKQLQDELKLIKNYISKLKGWELKLIEQENLTISKRQWKQLLYLIKKTCILSQRSSTSPQDFLKTTFQLKQSRKALKNYWNHLMVPLGVEPIDAMPKAFEFTCYNYGCILMKHLKWYDEYVEPFTNKLIYPPKNMTRKYINDLEKKVNTLILFHTIASQPQYYSNAVNTFLEDILNLQSQLESITSQLIFLKAWKARIDSFTLDSSQIQSLETWKQLIQKIGAGRGKHTSRLKVEARKLMPICQNAIPVWIMPLHKVIDYFKPSRNQFDVIIIDEASQMDMLGIVALYLGKKVLIVGDDQQVSPLAIGEKQEEVERLINAYLYDFPNSYLYSGKFSMYDLAQLIGYQPIKLKEHFRSVPTIIGYSNQLAYNGELKPLRSNGMESLGNPLRTIQVSGVYEVDGTNDAEADVLVNLICECIQQPQYKNKTFGVISLKGEKQATLIESKLHKRISPDEYVSHQLLCGTPAHFQGDERDIIFISLVDAPDKKGNMRLISEGIDSMYKKRYNVALSRAKDQVWLIHSFDPKKHLKEGDIRKGLFSYFEHCNTLDTSLNLNNDYVIPLEMNLLLEKLQSIGYSVAYHSPMDQYEFPMLIVGKYRQIGVICEGIYPKDIPSIKHILDREIQRKKSGWKFIHIPIGSFVSNPQKQLESLVEQLSSQGLS